jgi:hypothetical protein
MAQLRKDDDDAAGALAWGTRAVELAERLDEPDTLIHALNTMGTTELLFGDPAGLEKLERSLELALRSDAVEHVARGYTHLVWAGARLRRYELVDRYLDPGLAYTAERGIDVYRFYLLSFRARTELDRGLWDEAVDSARLVFQKRVISTFPRILASGVLGLVAARRGEPGAEVVLEQARALAEPTGELPRIASVAAGRAEVAWLTGEGERVMDEVTKDAYELALRQGASWPLGELAFWRWRAGLQDEAPAGAAEPYALQIAGDWARAAELWTELGCPYEAALALADADDEPTLRRALDELERLGAQPAAAIVAARLESVAASPTKTA